MRKVTYSLAFSEGYQQNDVIPAKNLKTLAACLQWANYHGIAPSLLDVSEWDETAIEDMGLPEVNYIMNLQLALDQYIPECAEEFEAFPYYLGSNGVCVNPIKVYTLYHKDYGEEALEGLLNPMGEEILFSIFVAYYDRIWYSGFIYHPNRDNSDHNYPICLKFSRKNYSKELAIQDGIDLFLSMYDSIKFQYRDFIYSRLNHDFDLNLRIDC